MFWSCEKLRLPDVRITFGFSMLMSAKLVCEAGHCTPAMQEEALMPLLKVEQTRLSFTSVTVQVAQKKRTE